MNGFLSNQWLQFFHNIIRLYTKHSTLIHLILFLLIGGVNAILCILHLWMWMGWFFMCTDYPNLPSQKRSAKKLIDGLDSCDPLIKEGLLWKGYPEKNLPKPPVFSFSHIIMVQWKMAGHVKAKLTTIWDTPIFHWTMIMGGRVQGGPLLVLNGVIPL